MERFFFLKKKKTFFFVPKSMCFGILVDSVYGSPALGRFWYWYLRTIGTIGS